MARPPTKIDLHKLPKQMSSMLFYQKCLLSGLLLIFVFCYVINNQLINADNILQTNETNEFTVRQAPPFSPLLFYPISWKPKKKFHKQNETLTSTRMDNRQRRYFRWSHKNQDANLFINTELPMLNIGQVDISDEAPNCSKWLWPNVELCQRQYEELLRHTIISQYNKGDESFQSKPWIVWHQNYQDELIKKISCCGMWHARDCLIDLLTIQSKPDDCPFNLKQRYKMLPNGKNRDMVFDYCSEYSDGSEICQDFISSSLLSSLSSTLSGMKHLITFLIIISIIINTF